MFQVAVAALFRYGIKPKSKKIGHDWVQAEFSKMFIRQNKRFPRLKGLLNAVQESRDIADYSTQYLTKKKAKRVLEKAKAFVETIFKEINNES
ncbi:hypothetical protein GMMP15_120008 [Candidatus Magnetomoraceae bacterium gMMP-15]